MSPAIFLRGLIIGLSIAAQVGPISILCIRRTLAEGRLAGLATGMGAATADALYGAVAGFGVTFISQALISELVWFRLIGGLFLCYLGLRTFTAPPAEREAAVGDRTLLRAYASTVALTLANPMTILSFAAVFAGLGAGTSGGSTAGAVALVLGVLLGSALWWVILTSAVTLLRSRVTARLLRWINYVSGSVLVAFGLLALLSLR